MARAHFVKAARKDYPDHGIAKGESYYWWKFRTGGRGGPKHFSKTAPKGSQLTQSEYLGQHYALQEELEALAADEGLEDAVSDIATRFRELGEEQSEKKNNMPDSLQDSDTGNMLDERAEKCESIASELEGLTFDIGDKDDDQTPEEFWESRLEEVQGVGHGCTMSDKARPCTYCGSPYIEPCDGKNPKCGNKPLADERKAAEGRRAEGRGPPCGLASWPSRTSPGDAPMGAFACIATRPACVTSPARTRAIRTLRATHFPTRIC
jgi:hypothetical protein